MLTPTLAMLSFLAPWLAAGAVAAVGLPLLAHLLSKTRYREAVFPAARLVRQAVVETSRIEKPRHRILMLLRWLLLLLVVLAFMRPRWTPQAGADTGDRGIALIVLIDASASMGRVEDGATLYERAVREATTLIQSLDPSRDAAAVVRVQRTAQPLLPEPTAQFRMLTDRLATTRSSYESADWPAAVAAAQRLAERAERRARLVVISDQQGEGPNAAISASGLQGATVQHLRVDGPDDNTAVRLVDLRPYPPAKGRPLTATIELQHFGNQAVEATLASVLGPSTQERAVRLEPGALTRLDLTLLPTVAGPTRLAITLDRADAIEGDNTAGAIVDVQAQTRALVVHDSGAAQQQIAERIAAVLNPGEAEGLDLPDVRTVPSAEAASLIRDASPEDLRTAVLVNAAPLTDELSRSLEAFAQRGGGVVRFVGEPKSVSATASAAGIDFSLEPLRVFEGPARAGLVSLSWPGVDNAPIDDQAVPLLTASDGRVIAAAMPRGRGRLVALNTALSAEPGGLLAEPAFVVLFHELCRYASPGVSMPAPARPGDAYPGFLLAPNRSLPTNADTESDGFTAPGAYLRTDERGQVIQGVWAALDPAESDTRPGDAWSVRNTETQDTPEGSPASASALAATIRPTPVELWPYLVLGALLLAAGESALLLRFAGPKGGDG